MQYILNIVSNLNLISHYDKHKNTIYSHVSAISLFIIMWFMCSVDILNILHIILFVTSIVSMSMNMIYFRHLTKTLTDSNKYKTLCLDIACKNYRILREYYEIYQHYYKDILKDCYSHIDTTDAKTKTYTNYIMDNDVENKLQQQKWVIQSIENISNYIKLSYYLTFLNNNDKLEIRSNKIYMNIKSDSLLNKRNRKLEQMLNTFSQSDKYEIVKTWNMIQNKQIISSIPYKLIIYEYRKIFRHLYTAKYFKDIYSTLDKDYIDIENLVLKLRTSSSDMFDNKDNKPNDILINIMQKINELFVIVSDCYVAFFIVNMWNQTNLLTYILSCVATSSLLFVIEYIKYLYLIKTNSKAKREDLDDKLEAIYTDMDAIMIYNNI